MCSPLGHALAGAVIYYGCQRAGMPVPSIASACMAAILPDLDFIPGLLVGNANKYHRGFTHSLAGVMIAALILTGVRKVAGSSGNSLLLVFFFTMCLLAHLLCDYFTQDYPPEAGIPIFWPLNSTHHMSPWIIFGESMREPLLSRDVIIHNGMIAAVEVGLFMPPLLLLAFA